MSDCFDVTIDAFLADGLTPDGAGIVWTVQRLDGWFDSTSARVERTEVQPLGEVVTLVRENARALALQVVAHAPLVDQSLGAELCFTAIHSIEAAIHCVNVPQAIVVTDPVRTTSATVYLVGPIKHAILGESVAVRFQVPLLAPSPYRFDGITPYD